jgi:alcohol dehydrogenase class IV
MEPYRFVMNTEIIYGIGASERIGSMVQELGRKKSLIISDPGVVKAGLLAPIQHHLTAKGISVDVFDDIEQSSSVDSVDRGAALIQRNGVDVIIAIGGGSAVDSGKAMGLVAANGGICRDYAGSNKAKVPAIDVIALPTTAGTSAEVTDVAVIADREKNARLGLRSPYAPPRMAIIDPLLTLSMPAYVTAATGMDALSHAIESYTNTITKDPTEITALEAIRMIGANLPAAVANGRNMEARERMCMACVLTGIAYRNTRLGILHAITGPFCGYYEVAHGVANSVLLPHVMRFNMHGNYKKFAAIAEALGVSAKDKNVRQLAEAAAGAVQNLLVDVGLPETFDAMNLNKSLLPKIAEEAAKSGNMAINPRIATAEDLLAICEKAF